VRWSYIENLSADNVDVVLRRGKILKLGRNIGKEENVAK